MTDIERLREKAAGKRLALECVRGGGGWQYLLTDTKHGVLVFKCNRHDEAKRFVEGRRV